MKCINKFSHILILFIACGFLFGCGDTEVSIPYGQLDSNNNYSLEYRVQTSSLDLFAEDLCATSCDITDTSAIDRSIIYAAAVFNLDKKETLYSYNACAQINPASVTKIMTSLIVLENCTMDEVVVVPDVTINESGAQLFHINEGDKITVKNLLYANLVYSGNDASLALAKYVAGTEEAFCQLMNDKAKALGCTATNFTNSNGLTAEDHYTSIYDLYLIFNEALKYQDFQEMINTSEYEISYTSESGEYVTKSISSTDKFLIGDYKAPDNITIIGGKTGSTNAAGKCLMLYYKDAQGQSYIAAIMGAPDEPTLYTMMSQLISDTSL